ncbi:helix-turn-helix domain-containing protein [bacterium]|nr:helix-turn-helix domain-containing protein [bacterium]
MAQKSFGQTIKELRMDNTDYSLRQLASLLDVSAPYLSDIERDRRDPPRADIVIKMAELLSVEANELLALADKTPPDFHKTFKKNPTYTRMVPEFMRTANKSNLSKKDWEELIEIAKNKGEKR